MRKIIMFGIVMVLSFAVMSIQTEGENLNGIGEAVALGQNEGAMYSLDAALDANGDLHLVWLGGGTQIKYAKYLLSEWDGSGKIQGEVIDMGETSDHRFINPAIAVDSNGDVHMVWGYMGGTFFDKIFYKHTINGQWTQKEVIHEDLGNTGLLSPDIAIAPDDTIYVVMGHTAGNEEKYADVVWKTPGGNWQLDSDIGNHGVYYPTIAASEEDLIYVAWESKAFSYSVKSGGRWYVVDENACSYPVHAIFPSIDVDKERNFHGAFMIWEDDAGRDVYYITGDEGGATECVDLTEGDYEEYGEDETSISVDDSGNIAVIWRDNYKLHYAIKPAGGDWKVDWLPYSSKEMDIPQAASNGEKTYFVWADQNVGLSLIEVNFEGNTNYSVDEVEININPPRISPGTSVTVKVVASEDYYVYDKLMFCADDKMYSVQMNGLFSDQQNWIVGNAEATFNFPSVSSLPKLNVYACRIGNEWDCKWYGATPRKSYDPNYPSYTTDTTPPFIGCLRPKVDWNVLVPQSFDPNSATNPELFTLKDIQDITYIMTDGFTLHANAGDTQSEIVSMDLLMNENRFPGTMGEFITSSDMAECSPIEGSYKAGISGKISFDNELIKEGQNHVGARAVDAAGNTAVKAYYMNVVKQGASETWSLYKKEDKSGPKECVKKLVLGDAYSSLGDYAPTYVQDGIKLYENGDGDRKNFGLYLLRTAVYVKEAKTIGVELRGNDGHYLYLNGVEVLGKNVCSGCSGGSGTETGYLQLGEGWNIIEITLHNCRSEASVDFAVMDGVIRKKLSDVVDMMNPNPLGDYQPFGDGGGSEETCSDGIKNQNERGIDCGGVCVEGREYICGDNVDNDHDCGIDCRDWDCNTNPLCTP